jgi:hypothetical protein
MSHPGRQPKSASGRVLDDGPTSERKELGNRTELISSNSRDIVRRLLRAGMDSDRERASTTGGKIEPRMESVFPGHISENGQKMGPFSNRADLLHAENSNHTTITTPINLEGYRVSVRDEREDTPRRWRNTGELKGQDLPVTDKRDTFGSETGCPSGDFHFIPAFHNIPRQSEIDKYNATPQASLGGRSPYGLVHDRGVSIQLPESSSVVPERFHQGRESLSVTRNITVRESKQPKARNHDQDYQRRSSMSPSCQAPLLPEYPSQKSGMDSHPQIDGWDGGRNRGTSSWRGNGTPPTPVSNYASSSGGNPMRPPGAFAGMGEGTPGNGRFDINLTFEGRVVRHEVAADMRVSYLQDDAAAIYELTARDLVLVLFGMNPHTLPPQGRISDPPPVTPGSTVLIFNIAGMSTGAPYPLRPIQTGRPPVPLQGLVPPPNLNVSSKLLANFRLAKFDGATRN